MRMLSILLGLMLLGGCGEAGEAGDSEAFATFLAEVKSARYSDYESSKVAGPEAFEEMRGYLLDRYGTATVTRSYTDNGITFDCVEGAATADGAACPAGSVPVRRTTLADLTRFATLQDFLAKSPVGGHKPSPS